MSRSWCLASPVVTPLARNNSASHESRTPWIAPSRCPVALLSISRLLSPWCSGLYRLGINTGLCFLVHSMAIRSSKGWHTAQTRHSDCGVDDARRNNRETAGTKRWLLSVHLNRRASFHGVSGMVGAGHHRAASRSPIGGAGPGVPARDFRRERGLHRRTTSWPACDWPLVTCVALVSAIRLA